MRVRHKVSPVIGSDTRASFGRLRKLHSSVETMTYPRLTMGRMTGHSMAEHKRILLVGAGAHIRETHGRDQTGSTHR